MPTSTAGANGGEDGTDLSLTIPVWRRRPVSALVGVWLLSFAIIVWGSWRPAWSGDEAATAMVVRRSLAGVLRTFEFDPALEPYYLVMKFWSFASTSEFWLRLPSVLAMATAVTVVYVLTVRAAGRRAGAFAALVMLALPATSRYGHEARPNALSLLLVIMAVLVWDDKRLLAGWRRQVLLVAFIVLAGAAHPYALLVMPVLLLTSALAPRHDRRREVMVTASACAVSTVVLAPFLLAVAQRANGQPNASEVTAGNVVEEFLRLPAGVLSPALAVPFAIAALAFAAAGFVLAWPRGGCVRRSAWLAAFWLLVPPISLCVFQVATGSPGLVARYWVISLAPIAIAAAFALDAGWSRSRAFATLSTVMLYALAIPAHSNIRGEDGHLGQRWRDLPEVLDLAAVHEAALLTEGWTYRGLVSNNSSIASRMPLVLDPAPSGRVNPEVARPGSDAFRALSRDHDMVVVLQSVKGLSTDLPSRRSFTSFREELRQFPSALVVCTYFGEPLGVFTKDAGLLGLEEAQTLAHQIAGRNPRDVRCAVP